MAKIDHIATWAESGAYLQMLRDTIANDIRPLLATKGGAPFAIFREVMSYIDHLGELYCGKGQSADRFVLFLTDVFAKIDPNYAIRAQEIYHMYRCGPVHEFCPKILQNDSGQTLAWLSYPRGRKNVPFEPLGKSTTVSHLELLHDRGRSLFYLPMSSACLVDDLDEAIEIFSCSPESVERVTAWNRAAKRLGKPHRCDFSL
jgi:hypothetical protein